MNAHHEGRTDVRGRLTRYLGGRRRSRPQQLGIQIEGRSATGSTLAVSRLAVDDGMPIVLLPLDSQRSRPRPETQRLLAEPATRPEPSHPAAAATGVGAPRAIVDDGHVLCSTSSAVLRALRDLQDVEFSAVTPMVDATIVPAAVRGPGGVWTPEAAPSQDDVGSRGSR